MRRAERFLWQLKNNNETIRRRLSEIEARESALGLLGISYDAIRVQTSPRDKMCDGVAALLDACDELFKELAREQKKILEVEHVVERLSPVKQTIVDLRFRKGMSIKTIAYKISYSRAQTYNLYSDLLDEVEAILQEEDNEKY